VLCFLPGGWRPCFFLYHGNAYQDDCQQFVAWVQYARVDWDHAFGVPYYSLGRNNKKVMGLEASWQS
jgi:hypothetical protein